MGVLAALVVAAWLAGRRIAIGPVKRRLDLAAPGAGCAVALALSCATLAIWFINPYAALMLVPALHLWLLAAMARIPDRGPLPVALVVVGLLPLAVVVLYYMSRLSLNPLEALWYLFLLVTSGSVGVAAALFACVLCGHVRVPRVDARRPRAAPAGGPGRGAEAARRVRPGRLRGPRIARRHRVSAAPLRAVDARSIEFTLDLLTIGTAEAPRHPHRLRPQARAGRFPPCRSMFWTRERRAQSQESGPACRRSIPISSAGWRAASTRSTRTRSPRRCCAAARGSARRASFSRMLVAAELDRPSSRLRAAVARFPRAPRRSS